MLEKRSNLNIRFSSEEEIRDRNYRKMMDEYTKQEYRSLDMEIASLMCNLRNRKDKDSQS